MDRSSEIRAFLRTRRARITPEQARLALHAGPRRVPGPRCEEEVAQLAGVSVDCHIRLARDRTQGVSEAVLAANPLGCAQLADFASRPHRDRNFACSVFLDQAALSLSTDWERAARDTTASLRLYAGRHADDPQFTELIGSDPSAGSGPTTTSAHTPRAPCACTTRSSATSPDYVPECQALPGLAEDRPNTTVVYGPAAS